MMDYKRYLYSVEDNGPFAKSENIKKNNDSVLKTYDFEYEVKDFGEVKDKDYITDLYVGISSVEVMPSYLKVKMNYSGGNLEGKIWNIPGKDMNQVGETLMGLGIVNITGKWNEWPKQSGKFTVVIENYEKADIDPYSILPTIKESREDLRDELMFYISEMSEEKEKLALKIMEDIWDEFSLKPAAMGHHHHQLGGLLQHTVENLRIVYKLAKESYEEAEESIDWLSRMNNRICYLELKEHREDPNSKRFFSKFYDKEGHYPIIFNGFLEGLYNQGEIDLDVVLFSMIFHDVAKIVEYTHIGDTNDKYKHFFPGMDFGEVERTVGIGMDEVGSRTGHIPIGMTFLQNKMKEYEFTDGKFMMDVLGCISSHHGRLEWGANTKPITGEEYLIHLSDIIGAKFGSES